jgi:hypothetical protein
MPDLTEREFGKCGLAVDAEEEKLDLVNFESVCAMDGHLTQSELMVHEDRFTGNSRGKELPVPLIEYGETMCLKY